jgi:hypothetical protein
MLFMSAGPLPVDEVVDDLIIPEGGPLLNENLHAQGFLKEPPLSSARC